MKNALTERILGNNRSGSGEPGSLTNIVDGGNTEVVGGTLCETLDL